MLYAYVDESGDPGAFKPINGGSKDYTLGVVMVEAHRWNFVFDKLIDHRRFLRTQFGIPIREEIKAHYLVTNGGWFKNKGLNPAKRKFIFRSHLQLAQQLDLHAFAIHLNKTNSSNLFTPGADPRPVVWNALFQRLNKTFTHHDPNGFTTPIHLYHDEGDDQFIKLGARKARRYLTAGQPFGANSVTLPQSWLNEDPVPKISTESYFIQMADLVAWMASKTMTPQSSSAKRIAPKWDDLGNARYGSVNGYARSNNPNLPIGIVKTA